MLRNPRCQIERCKFELHGHQTMRLCLSDTLGNMDVGGPSLQTWKVGRQGETTSRYNWRTRRGILRFRTWSRFFLHVDFFANQNRARQQIPLNFTQVRLGKKEVDSVRRIDPDYDQDAEVEEWMISGFTGVNGLGWVGRGDRFLQEFFINW